MRRPRQLRLNVWRAEPQLGSEDVFAANGWHSAQEFVEALRGLHDRTTCPVFVRWTCWHWVPEPGGGLRRYDVAPGGRGTRKVTLVAFGLTRGKVAEGTR